MGVIKVTGDIIVTNGATLFINEGVIVLLSSGVSLRAVAGGPSMWRAPTRTWSSSFRATASATGDRSTPTASDPPSLFVSPNWPPALSSSTMRHRVA